MKPSAAPEPKAPVETDAFQVENMTVKPGHALSSRLPIGKLPTGGELSLPLTVLHGALKGPVLAVTAAIHGDELNGTLAITRLLEVLRAKDLAGTLLALPILNPLGLLNHSRYLPDRRDLNRCFPGSKRGSLGSRIAHALTTCVLERADAVIDLHTGSLGRCNAPQLRCNLNDPAARKLARVFGVPIVLHAGLRDGSLRAVCAQQRRPALVYEGGEARRADNWAVDTAYHGILRVMRHLDMLKSLPEDLPPTGKQKLFADSMWLRAHRAGFCQLDVGLGERVKAGQRLGRIRNPVEKSHVDVSSDRDGLVIGRLMTALVNRGDALVHLATERYG